MVNVKLIETAFSEDSHLKKRVFDAIREAPKQGNLFETIAEFIETIKSPLTVVNAGHEPLSKKRKIENGVDLREGPAHSQLTTVVFEGKNLSFSIPQRKKLDLEILQGLDPQSKRPLDSFTIRTKTASQVVYEAPLSAYKNVILLPVPEKAQKQYNFCLIPEENGGADGQAVEPIVWTVSDGAGSRVENKGTDQEGTIAPQERDVIATALESAMRQSGTKVVRPEEGEFVSQIAEAHRKGEKSYHVKTFKGSKDGYLFFLPTGIFFGFKKPVQFFTFDEIESISYTSVLQRTFNLNIAYKLPGSDELREQEFSMIDQLDFAGIDGYIKKHELQDASMAEARKAKKLNVNGGRKGAEPQEDGKEDEASELQKAQQEMEDAEDEEEEDYDPGSDGESEGSGASSEEEDEDAEEAGDDGDVDLVDEELGSEAEDVEPETDDGDQL